ncbi:hypothetical protein [Spirosoma linguale]|uniref:Outer membrane protein beta-barrel domain-containing protein n=1 Tax=Spirosoma linguale (strain ATCC 33905 / DSM 74 / LMG 10896 / Claus 1) TaxID=504472 RepID=D2QQ22_SPILD|nr:hypothetical protein Slin_1709 [Spirosoma linguale DSM 74]
MKTASYPYLIIFLLVTTVSHQLIAQQLTSSSTSTALSKGSKQLTISYGYGRGNLAQNRSVTQIQAGYYVVNRLLIGVAGSMMREWIGEFNTDNKFSAGPLVRYQFTSSRLSPFAQLVYQLGNPTVDPTRNQAVVFTPGVNLALLSHVRIEASYGFLFIPNIERIGQPQLGATILFGNKH